MPARRFLLPLALALAILPAAAHAVATQWVQHREVSSRLVAPWGSEPRADGTLLLGLHLRLAPAWHAYWKNSGDAGFPPQVEVAAQPPVERVELLYPAPERYQLPGGLEAFGYEDEVVYPLRLTPALGRPPERLRLVADYLVCAEDCIPFRDAFELSLPAAGPVDPEESALVERWLGRLPVAAEGAGVVARATWTDGRLVVDLEGATALSAEADLFFAPSAELVLGTPTATPRPGGVRFAVPAAAARAGDLGAPLVLAWTATGIAGLAAPAVEGTVELPPPPETLASAEPQGPSAAADDDDDAGRDPAAAAAAPAAATAPTGARTAYERPGVSVFLDGLLLALAPSLLPLLALHLLSSHRRQRQALGESSLPWPVFLGAFAGFLAWAGLAALLRVAQGQPIPLEAPWALAAFGLPQLAFALLLWLAPGSALAVDASAGRSALSAVLAPLLAVAWAPLSPSAGAAFAGVATPLETALGAAGFAFPFLLVGLAAAAIPAPLEPQPHPRWVQALGFLPAAALVWLSYRLLEVLPPHRLAFVQLAWLGVALGARLTLVARGGRRWVAAAATAGLGAVAVALAAGRPW
ncbi:MAG TPA: protein-disulfide reductase DsbD domain-containing protein [Thermoanaerobaculia bacterium]|nr:protein-disulfide reductase DsbD domain-containing protein [Thermoanaerobaculia bacterium]